MTPAQKLESSTICASFSLTSPGENKKISTRYVHNTLDAIYWEATNNTAVPVLASEQLYERTGGYKITIAAVCGLHSGRADYLQRMAIRHECLALVCRRPVDNKRIAAAFHK